MINSNLYKDIATRTNGDIYIGVVGPVRTGKSTFISKVMESFVLPNIKEKYVKDRAIDEMPQSGDGKLIMTTQPKFVPNEAVNIRLDNDVNFNIRLIDCVGYLIDGDIDRLRAIPLRRACPVLNALIVARPHQLFIRDRLARCVRHARSCHPRSLLPSRVSRYCELYHFRSFLLKPHGRHPSFVQNVQNSFCPMMRDQSVHSIRNSPLPYAHAPHWMSSSFTP